MIQADPGTELPSQHWFAGIPGKEDIDVEEKKQTRIIKRGDLLLLAGILLFAGVFWLAVHFLLPEGKQVVVLVDGKAVVTLSLAEDAEYVAETPEGRNVIRISGGEVRVTEADCPDKLCAKHSPICRSGETIVCLPHKLIVEVTGE